MLIIPCYFTAFGVIVALFGLIYSNRKSDQRETRKEYRSKIDQLNVTLNQLVSASQNYYLDSQAIQAKEIANIHHAFNCADRLITDFHSHSHSASLNTEFYALYDKVTGSDFESNNLQPGKEYTTLCRSISIHKEALTTKTDEWFKHAFQYKSLFNKN